MPQGIHTALVTPFDNNLEVDTEALGRSVEHQIAAGIAGLCPLGGTGEPLSQTLDEHRLVIDTVINACEGRVPVTVGCLRGAQAEVIDIARHAKAAGATQIMVVPPYFHGARLADIKHHYQDVAEVRISSGHRCGAVAIDAAGDDSERRVGV